MEALDFLRPPTLRQRVGVLTVPAYHGSLTYRDYILGEALARSPFSRYNRFAEVNVGRAVAPDMVEKAPPGKEDENE